MEPHTLKLGDACPACDGDFKPAPVPTDEQYRKAFDRENPVALKPSMDTAPPDVRAELGALYRCVGCGYQARFKGDADDTTVDDGKKKKK